MAEDSKYLSSNELNSLGFKSIGSNVRISRTVRIYHPDRIDIGSNVRVDDFSLLSPGKEGIKLGNYVHISAYCGLVGKAKIELKDFVGLSSRVYLYSSSDDYSGLSLTNPTVPNEFTNVESDPILIGKHVILGTCATVLPGVSIGNSSAIGAYSLVNNDIPEGVIAVGQPCVEIRKRDLKHLELEKKLLSNQKE
jgi:galactoside O-acetyltransferase